MYRCTSLGAALLALAVLAGGNDLAAQTTLEYSNGSPIGGGFDLFNTMQAADFSLSTATTLTAFRFWTVDFRNDLPITGAYNWTIFSNALGAVGGELISGSLAPDRTILGPSYNAPYDYDLVDNWVTLPSVYLDAGDYWMGLSGPDNAATFWASSDGGDTGGFSSTTYWRAKGSENPWSSLSDYEVAFELYSGDVVPEPMSVVLLATGLVGLAGVAWRRRERDSTAS